jgi:hypothetical protein
MQGVSLTDISRVLGNTLAVCEKHYAKYQPEYLMSAVNSAYGDRSFAAADRVARLTGVDGGGSSTPCAEERAP